MLVGYSSAELNQLTLLELTPESGHQPMREALGRVLASGRPGRYEKIYRRKDLSLIPVEVAVDLDRDDEGIPVGYYAFVTDLVQRKAVETALRESEERFRRLYDDAPVGYHEIDLEGRIVSINRTECELIGYSREEVLGRPFVEFIAEESRAESREMFEEQLRGERPLPTLERTIVTRDGRRLVVSIEVRLKRNDQGEVVGLLLAEGLPHVEAQEFVVIIGREAPDGALADVGIIVEAFGPLQEGGDVEACADLVGAGAAHRADDLNSVGRLL
jgi:PAS domain S-box-containing protein